LKIKTPIRISILGILLIFFVGCKNDVKPISIELTSSEKEKKKDSLILSNINHFLENNQSSVVQNYHFLCDSSMILPIREYDVKHKLENIKIEIGKTNVRITPIPGSFKIADGPLAEYRIENESLGKFTSYFMDIKLNDNFGVSDFKATLRFMKESNGIEKVSFKKEISATENYLIEEKLNKNWW
jgi:hypothetical protein